jgi:WD40 repeat protein
MSNNKIAIWDWSNNTVYYWYDTFFGTAYATILKYLSNGLLVGTTPNIMKFWCSNASNISLILNSNAIALEELSNGNLASAGTNGYINFWNLTTGAFINRITTGVAQYFLKQVCNYLLSASGDNRIYLWNLTSLSLVGNLTGHTAIVRLLEATPNGLVLSASLDNSIRLWDLTNLTCLSILANPLGVSKNITGMRLVSSNTLAVVGAANYIALIQIKNATVLSKSGNISLPVNTTFAYDLRVASSNVLVVAVSDGSVAFFNLTTNLLIKTATPPVSPVTPVICLDLMSIYNLLYGLII